jgi:hypothetical protein
MKETGMAPDESLITTLRKVGPRYTAGLFWSLKNL